MEASQPIHTEAHEDFWRCSFKVSVTRPSIRSSLQRCGKGSGSSWPVGDRTFASCGNPTFEDMGQWTCGCSFSIVLTLICAK